VPKGYKGTEKVKYHELSRQQAPADPQLCLVLPRMLWSQHPQDEVAWAEETTETAGTRRCSAASGGTRLSLTHLAQSQRALGSLLGGSLKQGQQAVLTTKSFHLLAEEKISLLFPNEDLVMVPLMSHSQITAACCV